MLSVYQILKSVDRSQQIFAEARHYSQLFKLRLSVVYFGSSFWIEVSRIGIGELKKTLFSRPGMIWKRNCTGRGELST